MEDDLKELVLFYKAKYKRNENMYKTSKISYTENKFLLTIIEDLERLLEGKQPLTWEIKN